MNSRNIVKNIFSPGKKEIRVDTLILFVTAFFTVFYNVAFFDNIFRQYSLMGENFPFVVSLGVFLFAVTVLLLGVVCYRCTIKPVLMLVFPMAALSSYFMNSYNIVVDTTMLGNVFATDRQEARDLLSSELFLSLLLLGMLPAWWVLKLNIKKTPFRQTIISRAMLLTGAVSAIVFVVAVWSPNYASFFREHKQLRYYANPATALYSLGKYSSDLLFKEEVSERSRIGMDAKIPDDDFDRELVVLVLGETARADHFSLNGYQRKTNPLLEGYPVINFPHVTSCATATAISLPCMFSITEENDFDVDDADSIENLLDVLDHADIYTLWRDNNSDSKGVAVNIEEENYKDPEINPICDIECRDIGMLAGLDEYIEAQPDGDIVIILHQMGNHGPAYYKRYPKEFELFSPVCKSNNLAECSDEEVVNAYDNAIVYTDYFLANVIEFLQGYDDGFETAMFYISDHGESLGELGLYLHGLPNFMAPKEQRHVPALMWFGENYEVDRELLRNNTYNNEYSHDHFFHTVLSFMEIESEIYDPSLDILHKAHL